MWKLIALSGALFLFGTQAVEAQHVEVQATSVAVVITAAVLARALTPAVITTVAVIRMLLFTGLTGTIAGGSTSGWIPSFTVYLGPQPYAGPGYQIVNVYFADGSVLNNVYVYNQDQIELPPAFAGRQIVRLVVVGGG